MNINIKEVATKYPQEFEALLKSEVLNKLYYDIDISKLFDKPEIVSNLIKCGKIDYYFLDEIKEVSKQLNSSTADINNAIIGAIFTTLNEQWCSSDVIRIIKEYEGIFTDEIKEKIADIVFDKINGLYSYAKKEAVEILIEYSNKELLINTLKTYPKHINTALFQKALTKIDLEDIKETLSKSKKLRVYLYNEEDIKDITKKAELVKHIVRNPTAIPNIDYNINITYDDLINTAPVMRFEFIKKYYSKRFDIARYTYNYNHTFITNAVSKLEAKSKIKLDLTDKQMNDLLFPVGIKKNQQTTKWLSAYEAYKNLIDNKIKKDEWYDIRKTILSAKYL